MLACHHLPYLRSLISLCWRVTGFSNVIYEEEEEARPTTDKRTTDEEALCTRSLARSSRLLPQPSSAFGSSFCPSPNSRRVRVGSTMSNGEKPLVFTPKGGEVKADHIKRQLLIFFCSIVPDLKFQGFLLSSMQESSPPVSPFAPTSIIGDQSKFRSLPPSSLVPPNALFALPSVTSCMYEVVLYLPADLDSCQPRSPGFSRRQNRRHER